MKSLAILFLTAAAVFLAPVGQASAVTPVQPHDFTCASCHSPHKTLGSTGYDNICLNCHRGGDPRAGAKSFAPGDAADPFGLYSSGVSNRYQISHRWDGSDTNVRAGAAPPVQAPMTAVRARTSGALACVRCHNPHSEDNRPFLRMANGSDQMCMDCHRSRNTADQTKGTHPVGVDYQQKASANPAAFNPSPVNANPSNPTSALKLPGGKVSCSTCHGVHATDSNSSTFDSFSSLSDLKPSDGSLLRTDRRAATAAGINICTNCHAGKAAHNGRGQNIQCSDCHGAHVDPGDGSVPNVWLVKRDMGAGRGKVFFNSTTVKNYMSSDSSGVCQSCHAVPTGSGYQFHLAETNATCNNCHAHGNVTGSFSVDPSKACNACHGYPPLLNSAGAGGYASGYQNAPSFTDESVSGHGSHASAPYQKACINCHNGNNHQDGVFQDVFNSPAGTVAETGGLSPVYNKTARTCSTVYCHSNANPRGGTNITKTTPSWNGGKGKIIGAAGECGTCHSAAGDPSPTWSASHTRHINGYAGNLNFTCNLCHAGTASGNAAIFNNITARSLHTNGVKDVVFNSFATGGTWDPASAACTNLYCHSNVQGSAGVGTPTSFTPGLAWNGTAMTCGSCHAAMVVTLSNISTATGGHKRHVQGYSYDCSVCHGTGYSAKGTSVPVLTHVDGTITMGFTGIPLTNGAVPSYYQGNNAPGDGYKNCSNSYCHSNVQGIGGVGAPASFAAPDWGTKLPSCGGCHANMATSGAATGSHIQHAQTAGYGCPTCHNGAGKDPNPPFAATVKHADGIIEIAFTNSTGVYSKGGSVTPGTGYGSCSNISCHADPYSTATVQTPVWGTGTGSGCAGCHNGAGTFSGIGNGPATGSHNKHMAAKVPVACGDCHAGTVAGSKGGTAHGDGNIDVTNGYPVNVAKHDIGTLYTGTCSTTCHSPTTAAVPTPVWGTASTCSSCHDSAPSTGGHLLHSGLSVQAVCINCHAGAVVDSNAGTAHLNGAIDVTNGYPANVAKHAEGTGYSTCSAASCHANPYGIGSVTTPVWGLGTGNHCAACHNGSGAFDAVLGSPATGSHAMHMASGAVCSQCHTGASSTVYNDANHKNGTIDVINGYPAVAKHAAGTYSGSCSASTCHGPSSPVWGANTASATCTKCHGKPVLANYSTANAWQAAPGYAQVAGSGTYVNNVSNTAPYGAHDAHVRAVNAYTTNEVQCSNCHGALPTSGSHANGTVNISWSNLAQNIGTTGAPSTRGALVPGYAAGTCSATYCHGARLVGGVNTAPTWTGTAYLTPYAKTAANCEKCHGAPPQVSPANFLHAGITIANDCSGCHGHNGNGPAHINGILEASGGSCNSCHSYDSGDWATSTHNFGGTAAREGIGAHAKHIVYLKSRYGVTLNPSGDSFGVGNMVAVCGVCHTINPANHTMSDNTQPRSINFGDGALTHQFGPSAPLYNGVYNSSSAINSKSCSNIDCHYSTTPPWSSF